MLKVQAKKSLAKDKQLAIYVDPEEEPEVLSNKIEFNILVIL